MHLFNWVYLSADFAIGQFALHAVGDEFASWRYFHFARSWKNLYNWTHGWLTQYVIRTDRGNLW